ncbi:MAG: endonuclease/exonuclease/phosphatase family protein [Candidatus Symbiothrix sp.]|jgi:endonuclease/exonuclease/phosphatase family metal-dependent hydrolase|nr:endonuclease/exonuclease/phosphatase family protein [Candidatus Symbiothrix sp.]
MQKNNFFLRWVKRLITILAVLSLVVLLFSAFADRVSPLTSRYIPFLGLFFPFILAFNVAFGVFWLLFRQWKQFFLTVVVLFICWASIRTYFSFHNRTKNLPENCVKMLTYNTMSLGRHHRHTKSDPNPILQYIVEQDPDILCLQEYVAGWNLPEAEIRRILKSMPYFCTYPNGLALFSKFPILSSRKIPIESNFNSSMLAELDVNGRKLTLINNHLESNKISADERNEYYDLTKDWDKDRWESFTYRMYQRLNPAFQLRAKQAVTIRRLIDESKNPYIIVCGDFNDTPISYSRRVIKGDLVDAFVESGSGMGISFNSNRFLFRIDYIFHSKNIKSYNCTVGKLKASDHYPVWTYLEFL